MKKASRESIILAKHIHTFLSEYAPTHKTQSEHTIKSYEYAISLYISFLENVKKISPDKLSNDSFDRSTIEEWMVWLINRAVDCTTINFGSSIQSYGEVRGLLCGLLDVILT